MGHDPDGRQGRTQSPKEERDALEASRAAEQREREQEGILHGELAQLTVLLGDNISRDGGISLREATADQFFVILQQMAQLTDSDIALKIMLKKVKDSVSDKASDYYSSQPSMGTREVADALESASKNAEGKIQAALLKRSFAGFMSLKSPGTGRIIADIASAAEQAGEKKGE